MPTYQDNAFDDIYHTHSWGGVSRSGPGSEQRKLSRYIRLLQRFIDHPANRIQSIVDLGCGDWSWCSRLHFGDRQYIGLDVVPSIVDRLQREHGSPTVSFRVTNSDWDDLPHGDLLLVKDVLQHLSAARVERFLSRVLPSYRLAIITNDIAGYHQYFWPLPWPRKTVGEVNSDIADGDWRPLDVRLPPYSLQAVPLLTFGVKMSVRTLDVKQTVLHRGRESTP